MTKGSGKAIETGDILAVEYEGYVSGSKAPFTKGSKQKFTFKDGTMIPGWDVAVGSMKVGEKSKFKIGSKYGYGEKGVANIIPPNSEVTST